MKVIFNLLLSMGLIMLGLGLVLSGLHAMPGSYGVSYPEVRVASVKVTATAVPSGTSGA